jgi:putative hydrolase of the HAD superfamily
VEVFVPRERRSVPMLKAVFIDVGNTLLYEKPSRFEIYAEGARRRGVELSTEAMTELMRRAHRELPREVAGGFRYTDPWFTVYITRIFHEYLGIAKSELGPLQAELFGRFGRAETFALFPGAIELLESLRRRGLALGIVSNWSPRLPRLLDELGVAARVDFVLCSALERAEKPAAELFERALARAGVGPGEALHAGDDVEKDLRGARAAGLAAVLVDRAGAHAGEEPRVGDLFELEALVAELAR